MPSFLELTIDELKRRVGELTPPEYETRRRFYDGNHWNDGEDWVGPGPQDADAEGFDETWDELARGFVFRNVVLEGTDRHAGGVVGNEPAWRVTLLRALAEDEKPTPAETALIEEAEAALTTWYNVRQIPEALIRFVVTMLLAGRAPWRLYVPPGRLVEVAVPNGRATPLADAETDDRGEARVRTVQAATIAQGLDAVFLVDPTPEQAAVIEDPDTKREAGVYIYQKDGRDVIEVVFVQDPTVDVTAPDAPTNRAAPATPGAAPADRPQTVIAIYENDGWTQYVWDFGGRLTIAQGVRPAIISDAVLTQQRALNCALSMLPRNVVTGGFLERILLNAQMPGTWTRDENGQRLRFTPEPYYTGAGTTNFVQGADVEQPDGTMTVADPSVVFRPPTPVDPAVDAERAAYRAMLEELRQAHVLMNADAGASGISREQAREDYIASLKRTARAVEAVGRWLLETALAMGEAFMGQPGKYTSTLRVDFNCLLDAGPLTADEQRLIGEMVDKNLVAEETGMARLGVADVNAERERIKLQPGARLALLERQATILAQLVTAGVPIGDAAEIVGMDDDAQRLLRAIPEPVSPEEGDEGDEGDENAPSTDDEAEDDDA